MNPGLPIINSRQAGEVRLSDGLKRRLARRANRAASRKYDPKIQALRGQKQSLRRAQGREMASNQGYVNANQEALQGIIEGLRGSGLKGGYLQDAISELTAQKADQQSALPMLNAETRSAFREQRSGLKGEIIDTKIARETEAQDKYYSLAQAARNEGQSAIEGRAEDRAIDREEIRRALHEGARLLAMVPDDEAGAFMDPMTWKLLEGQIRSAEGIGFDAARRAALVLARRANPMLSAGRTISQAAGG